MNTWTPSNVPSGKVKETAGMGGDKMMVDIDAFLDKDEDPKSNTTNSKQPPTMKTNDLNKGNDTKEPSVDLGAFLNNLKDISEQQDNPTQSIMKVGGAKGQSMKQQNNGGNINIAQRHPRVSIAGVTDVQEAPKTTHHHHHKKGTRKREPVTEKEAKEVLMHMKELRENQGINGLVTFLKKNAGIGPNDEV